jgi:ABC-type transport system substrate-binding protein
MRFTRGILAAVFGAAMVAAGAGVATAAPAHPAAPASPATAWHYLRAAQPATSAGIIDGSGADLPILSEGHGEPVETSTGETFFTNVSYDGDIQYQQDGTTNCLTNNAGTAYMEGCASHSAATLWTYSGGLVRSVLSGYVLTAADMTSCTNAVGDGVWVVGGSWPSCAQHWSVP